MGINTKKSKKFILFIIVAISITIFNTPLCFATYFATAIGTIENNENGNIITTTNLTDLAKYYYEMARIFY